ncbi:phage tail protein [Pseudanabaena sp. FACHB-2040]|uniref:phage tail protein n=1 Tax=Pseudanabaena sp. FACHB-2040 TaxID=2692859 RepID=UPI001684BCCA|nr:phage tail protein [Pseudanabaena sp. FACHB-2040]MBD2261376.1 phage tail protein [Pseudanabaena sp. FACHB-2040]
MVNSAITPNKRPKAGTQPFGLLGDIEIEVSLAPRKFSYNEGSSFAEHPRIEGTPTLQYTGEELRNLDLAFRFHFGWCNPDEQLKKLQKARRDRKPMLLLIGTGRFKTYYVIEEIKVALTDCLPDGVTLSIEVDVKLVETTDRPKPLSLQSASPFKKRLV